MNLIQRLLVELSQLEESRIYYSGDEPWDAVREVARLLKEYLLDKEGYEEVTTLSGQRFRKRGCE